MDDSSRRCRSSYEYVLEIIDDCGCVALVLLALTQGGVSRPGPVHADSPCSGDELGSIQIEFREDGGAETSFLGFEVNIEVHPSNARHDSSLDIVDNLAGDDAASNTGQIDVDVACQTDHAGMDPDGYDFIASIVPDSDADDAGCTIVDSTINDQTLTGDEGVVLAVEFEVDCEPNVNITISKSAVDDDCVDFEFTISGDNSCDEDFSLADGEDKEFECENIPDTYTISEEVPEGWALLAINCTDENVPSGDIVGDLENATVKITLSDPGDTVDCIFVNKLTVPGDPDSVTLAVSTTAPPCNLPIVVVATVKDEAGALLVDVLVTFSAPSGAFSIPSGLTQTGVISTLYTPPNEGSELVTLTATAGDASGTVQIQVNCAVATATATTVTPPTIQPPSTGDAGLGTGSAWLAYAGIAGLVATMFGAAFVTARRWS